MVNSSRALSSQPPNSSRPCRPASANDTSTRRPSSLQPHQNHQHPRPQSRRRAQIMSPISLFWVFSCVALCTSEALIPSSVPFLPLRGGSTERSTQTNSPTTTTTQSTAAAAAVAASSSTTTRTFGMISKNNRHQSQRAGSSSGKTSSLGLFAGSDDDLGADFVVGGGAAPAGNGLNGASSPSSSSSSNNKNGSGPPLPTKRNGSSKQPSQQSKQSPNKVRLARMPLTMPNGTGRNGFVVSSTAATATTATSAAAVVRDSASLSGKEYNLAASAGEAWVDRAIPAKFVAETNLPTEVGQFRLRAYRSAQSSTNEYVGREPSVIYAPSKSPFGVDGQLKRGVPIRVHDQCLTSEVFGSQRCDCSQQLKMSLKYVAENGGAIIYLQQEGRGIGLANKVAAYSLQDVGLDTVDANLHLGFPEDARQYGVIPSILDDMNIGSIQLMTNNPRKVARLRALGVRVDNTLPMVVPETNPHNHRYMEAKHDRMNHTNLSPLFVDESDGKPHLMSKQMPSLAEMYVSEGEEMAANAVQVSLNLVDENDMVAVDDDEVEAGVTAREDGYCFGRQSVEDAIAAVRDGKMVVVVDDMDRENEGDLIMAADACTPEDMATIVRYSSGVICIAMDGERMDKLGLPPMLQNNEDPKGTAFTVTVDATKEHGITTGISATDRAKTVNLLADPNAKPTDFARPGHIFPLRAREGGVLARDGHTEAAVDLSALAGRARSGILCEIVSEENPTEMARLPELKRFCRKHGYVLTSIVDIAQYRREIEAKGDDDLGI